MRITIYIRKPIGTTKRKAIQFQESFYCWQFNETDENKATHAYVHTFQKRNSNYRAVCMLYKITTFLKTHQAQNFINKKSAKKKNEIIDSISAVGYSTYKNSLNSGKTKNSSKMSEKKTKQKTEFEPKLHFKLLYLLCHSGSSATSTRTITAFLFVGRAYYARNEFVCVVSFAVFELRCFFPLFLSNMDFRVFEHFYLESSTGTFNIV